MKKLNITKIKQQALTSKDLLKDLKGGRNGGAADCTIVDENGEIWYC